MVSKKNKLLIPRVRNVRLSRNTPTTIAKKKTHHFFCMVERNTNPKRANGTGSSVASIHAARRSSIATTNTILMGKNKNIYQVVKCSKRHHLCCLKKTTWFFINRYHFAKDKSWHDAISRQRLTP